jgi:hypothetical protein
MPQTTSFEPQNPFESAFIKAADDPAARPYFLCLLLKSRVLIEAIGPKSPTVDGRITELSKRR